jgi:uncharacterized protein (DUF58 family)
VKALAPDVFRHRILLTYEAEAEGVPVDEVSRRLSRPRRSAVITPELLAQVRRLTIRSRRAVEEVFSGAYRSAYRGQGLEFAEVREYVPGDDVRAIDWNVTARAGRPFVEALRRGRASSRS